MRHLILIMALLPAWAQAHNIAICTGEYALCAASATTPTGRTMRVNGQTFRQGIAVCPILTGTAVANLDLMAGSCRARPHQVWSLFGIPPLTEYPQAPTWNTLPAVARTFTIGETATTGISNMWSFICDRQAEPVNGVRLATCRGPIQESPFTNGPVRPGELGFTQAPAGATWPVGGNAPQP